MGALKDFNDKLVALHKKKVRATRGAFEGLGGELSSNNAHAGQYKEANQRSRAHVIGWEVSDEIHTVLEAKTIKLYQAEKCAILYDKSVKRLISINPAGGSGALANNASTHDDIGRSTSYFETGGLVIDTDIEGGDRLVETFTLNRGGNELTVAAKLRRGDIGRPLEFKRVYTRVE